MENAKQHELLKLHANWAEKRTVLDGRVSMYQSNIVPQQRDKSRFSDQLHLKYKQQKEDKYQDEQMKKSALQWQLKSSHTEAIASQLKEKRAETELTRRREANMDKKQLDFKVAEDEEKLRLEAAMNLKRRNHARGLMLEADVKIKEQAEAQVNGAARGEKMTKDEYKLNKDLLREVAKIKKGGHFVNISERCTSRKITNFDD